MNEEFDKGYLAQEQGLTGFRILASKKVFDYLGVTDEKPDFYGNIDGDRFILTASVGPGARLKHYELRKPLSKKGERFLTLPKIWAEPNGIQQGTPISKEKQEYQGAPIVVLRRSTG